jgi:long-subunit fatty acid transport protein
LVVLFSVAGVRPLWADTIFQSVGIASSPNPVGSGARAQGMGSAFIAVADDATAASWNPAGLVQLERPEFSIVGDYLYREEAFSSASRPEIDNRNSVDSINLNYLSFSYPFALWNRNMVVSANFQRLYDFDRDFEYGRSISGGVIGNETVTFDQDGYLGAIGMAYALEITPRISLGVTMNVWTDALGIRNGWDENVRTTSTINAINNPLIGLIPVDPPQVLDIQTRDEYEDFSGINWNLGILWDINRYFTVGAILKTPFWGDLDHGFVQTVRDETGNLVSSTTIDESAELRLPMSYGAGISCRFNDRFSMALDAYRTDWSDYTFKDGDGNKFSPIDGRPIDTSDVEDTTQVRLGAEYLLLFPEKTLVVPLRAGIFYDPEPKEGSPKDFYGFSLGSGIGYGKVVLDAAYVFRWGNDVDGDNLITTGDTEVDARQHTFLMSLIVYF